MRLPFLAVRTRSPVETSSLGRHVAAMLRPGEVLLLVGDLGTGKTTFVQGIATGLGAGRRARSPSFTIVHEYRGGRFPLIHVDLYRCGTPTEVFDLGLEELFEPPSVSVVEWGEKAFEIAGRDYLELDFSWDAGDDVRNISFVPSGRWQERMGELSEAVRSWANGATPQRSEGAEGAV
jgi:tRNA threonylcarbamoyladenosine biosynthesis protein TsaE